MTSVHRIAPGITTIPNYAQNALGEGSRTIWVDQQSCDDNEVRGMWPVGKKRLRIRSSDGVDNLNVLPEAAYVRCSGDNDFPDIIRVYDANNFNCSFLSHADPLPLKARFGRACRAFVNAWREA